MSTFSYAAFSKDGRKTRGTIEASSAADARRLLRDRGLSVASLGDSGRASTRLSMFASFGRRLDHARLFGDLSVLLNAGLGIEQAIRAVREARRSRIERQSLQELLDKLTAGSSPASAFARLEGIPKDALALIVSGEKVARLPHVMNLLAVELKRRQDQKKELVDALIYPMFLLLIMGLAVGVLTFVLVPSLAPIFEGSGRPPPFVVALLDGLRQTLTAPSFLFAGTVFSLVVVAFAAMRPAVARSALTATILKLPVVGNVVTKIAIARFIQNLSLLLENSVPLPEALAIATDGCSIPGHRSKLGEARELVLSGKPLNEAFASIGIFPPGVLSLIVIGDEVNRLAPVMAGAAAAMQLEAQRVIDRATTLLTPTITIILGGLVGSLVISVMSALLSINELSM